MSVELLSLRIAELDAVSTSPRSRSATQKALDHQAADAAVLIGEVEGSGIVQPGLRQQFG